jgi:hypothetical protein
MFATLIRRCALVAALLPVAFPVASAQPVGDCEPGTAERDLDVNDVRARVFNGGNLFFGNTTVNGDGYLVPKHTGHSPIFSANLWIGGQVGGELRMSAATYGDFEFWPGPLDAEGNPPDDCSQYDRIYRVSRGDVARYYETGEAADDLRDWPVDLGAPVLDGDGVAGNYNLAGGDEPAISGEQMLWWVMNDMGNEHAASEAPPVQIEARVSAFAVAVPRVALLQSTFYRYRFTYRGGTPLDSAYVALFVDPDLGDAADDFVGSDTTLDMGFVYNAQEVDADYGVPPAIGLQFLRSPVGLPNGRDDDGVVDEADEQLGMTATPCYAKTLEPSDGVEFYRCMQSRWRDGTPLVEGGSGYPSPNEEEEYPLTSFSFAGDPVMGAFWSEENVDGEGGRNAAGDRRFIVVTGPFRLEPGETEEVVVAIPFAQGNDRLDSVVKLREAARYLRRAYDVGLFEPQRVGTPTEPEPPQAFALRAFPNPFAVSASVELTVAAGAGALRLAVYDVLGREVAVLADGVLAPGAYPFALDGAGFPAGVYFVRLATGRQTEALTLVHVE